ncbi:hypothetical protein [Pseudonocardia lacus]|uniref:hypothetical protein n=1 Tax=Pseudonocardia lacus TaxID=2835865 RepID=UPI001BDC1C19|nr:hypothetical protein [Pseudonocardia lacus]
MVAPYVRFQSPTPNPRGHFTGVFGLANGLALAGALSADEMEFWRTTNAWFHANFPLPDAAIYDRAVNPLASSWFKTATADFLLARVPGYLQILGAHGVRCVEVRSDAPGRIVYDDEYQVVAVPR